MARFIEAGGKDAAGRRVLLADDGFTLPLWQVETALGGLFVIFALATLWIARRSRWPL